MESPRYQVRYNKHSGVKTEEEEEKRNDLYTLSVSVYDTDIDLYVCLCACRDLSHAVARQTYVQSTGLEETQRGSHAAIRRKSRLSLCAWISIYV